MMAAASIRRWWILGVGVLFLVVVVTAMSLLSDSGYSSHIYRGTELSARLSYYSSVLLRSKASVVTVQQLGSGENGSASAHYPTHMQVETALPSEAEINRDRKFNGTVNSEYTDSYRTMTLLPTGSTTTLTPVRALENLTKPLSTGHYSPPASSSPPYLEQSHSPHLPTVPDIDVTGQTRISGSHESLRRSQVRSRQSLPESQVRSRQSLPESQVGSRQSLPESQVRSRQSLPESLVSRANNYDFTFPCPHNVYKPVHEVITASWVYPLLEFLSAVMSKTVTLVVANKAYEEILLNWLISATVVAKPRPIENIIVVCLDQNLWRELHERDIPSIYVPYSSILNKEHKFRRNFEMIMMIRLGFMRLINRLGYDVAMYDIDAIILKNPELLYGKYSTDIIGSRGALPKKLAKMWHVTICIGAVFIRSNDRTEMFWEAVTRSTPRKADAINDQIRLNHGLEVINVKWEGNDYIRDEMNYEAIGRCHNDLSVTVVPYGMICRYGCDPKKRDQYYIWHKGGSRTLNSKMRGAQQGHTWFLRRDWRTLNAKNSSLKGREWLKFLSYNAV